MLKKELYKLTLETEKKLKKYLTIEKRIETKAQFIILYQLLIKANLNTDYEAWRKYQIFKKENAIE